MIMMPYRQSSHRRSSQATQPFGTPQAAEALAAEITSAGGTAIAVGADLRRPEALGELV
jgi:hypothetical protein